MLLSHSASEAPTDAFLDNPFYLAPSELDSEPPSDSPIDFGSEVESVASHPSACFAASDADLSNLAPSSDDDENDDFNPPDPPPIELPRQQGNWNFFGFDLTPAWWFYASADNARAQASNLAQGLPPPVLPQHENDAAAAADAAADDAPDLNGQQDAPPNDD